MISLVDYLSASAKFFSCNYIAVAKNYSLCYQVANFMKFVSILTREMWSVATQFFSLMSVVAHKFVCVSFFLPQLLVDFVWSAGICY